MSGINFYKNLRLWKLPITSIFEPQYFSDIPADWYVFISDVKNSTIAVNEGRHNDVNLVAAGSLIAALNIAKDRNIEIPFFFGGDGGTFLVPQQLLSDVLNALSQHNANSIKNFGLEMHIGHISIEEVIKAGYIIKIAKVEIGGGFNKAVVTGDGLRYAEQQIKRTSNEVNSINESEEALNLNGLECRWDRIKPPGEENEVVCYLIETLNPAKQLQVYKDVLCKTDEIYGDMENRNPLSLEHLRLLLNFNKFKKEMLARFGKWKLSYLINTFITTFIGRLYFKYNWKVKNLRGQEYLAQLIANADTLTIDGRINTIITGKMDKRIQFTRYLAEQEKKGNLIYGHHISKESVMTCYIENRNMKHIHFVDGAEGGYTEAAKEFKRKLNLIQDVKL